MAPPELSILLAATAIGIAGWSQIIDSPQSRIESFDNPWYRIVTATSLFVSFLVMILTFLSLLFGIAANINNLPAGGRHSISF